MKFSQKLALVITAVFINFGLASIAYARTSTIFNDSQLYSMDVTYEVCSGLNNCPGGKKTVTIPSEKQSSNGATYFSLNNLDANSYIQVISVLETTSGASGSYGPKVCMDKQSGNQNGGVILDDNHGTPIVTCVSDAG